MQTLFLHIRKQSLHKMAENLQVNKKFLPKKRLQTLICNKTRPVVFFSKNYILFVSRLFGLNSGS